MVGDFGWEHEGTKSGVGTVKVSEKARILELFPDFTFINLPRFLESKFIGDRYCRSTATGLWAPSEIRFN